MAKLTLTDLSNLNTPTATTRVNENNTAIENAIENTLSRDGTAPNAMNAQLDMNSNRVINLPAANGNTEPVRKAEFDAAVGSFAEASVEVALDTLGQRAPYFETISAAEAYNPTLAPASIQIAFRDSTQIRGSGGIFKKENSEPSTHPKIQIAQGSWYGLREKRRYRPEQFGAIGNGALNNGEDDIAFARMLAALQAGDTVEFCGGHYYLANNYTISSLERLLFVGDAKFTWTTVPASQGGLFKLSSCPGSRWEGRFEFVGPETLVSWTALSQASKIEEKGSIYVYLSPDTVIDGVQGSQCRTLVAVRDSANTTVQNFKHTGFFGTVPTVVDNNLPTPDHADAYTTVAVRVASSNHSKVLNGRILNHGNAITLGNNGYNVTVRDIYARNLHDNCVYNSSGGDFVCENVHAELIVGSVVKSRGENPIIRNIKGLSVPIGVTLSTTDFETATNALNALVDGVKVHTSHMAVYVQALTGTDTFQHYLANVSLRSIRAHNMLSTDKAPITATVLSNFKLHDYTIDTFVYGYGVEIGGVTPGDGLGGRYIEIKDGYITGGPGAIALTNFSTGLVSGNMFGTLSAATNICVWDEVYDITFENNTSGNTAKRITFTTGLRNSFRNNKMYCTGATTLNEYWGNYNKQLVPIALNVPFKAGQMGYDSATGKAMIAEDISATTDWKLLY